MNKEEKAIKRHYCGNGEGMFEDSKGAWVRYEDVKHLIEFANQSNQQSEVEVNSKRYWIKEAHSAYAQIVKLQIEINELKSTNQDKVTEAAEKVWTEYSWQNKESHPPNAGRYLIYRRGCDKMHFEQWNGGGWASSNKDCTHWISPEKPNSKSTKPKETEMKATEKAKGVDCSQEQDTEFKVWDDLFGILSWKFMPTKSGDMMIDAEEVYNLLKDKFELKVK